MRLRSPSGTRVSVPDHMVDRYVARGWVPVGEREATPVPPAPSPEPDPEPVGPDEIPPGVLTMRGGGVPDGTAKDVVDWVGDDQGRARAALEVERAKGDDARSTLVARLTKIAGS